MASTEDISRRIPVNATASMVTSSPGRLFRHEFDIDSQNEQVFDAPPPMREYPPTSMQCDDIRGRKFDRLTAVGLSLDSNGWVCRCDCGKFCIRKGKSLKKMNSKRSADGAGRCVSCYMLVRLKKRDFFNRHGRWMSPQEEAEFEKFN